MPPRYAEVVLRPILTRRWVLNPVEVRLGAEVERAAAGGGRRHEAFVEVVDGELAVLRCGFDHGRFPALIEEIDPPLGIDRRGGVVAAEPLAPDLFAALRFHTSSHRS